SQADQVFIRDMDSAVAAWPLDDEEQTQSYARVINPYREEGRNIVINGTFDTDTGWSKGIDWNISDGKANIVATATSDLRLDLPLTGGKVFQITYEISNYVSGSMNCWVGTPTSASN